MPARRFVDGSGSVVGTTKRWRIAVPPSRDVRWVPNPLIQAVQCSLCFKPMQDPVMTVPCGHSFCNRCLTVPGNCPTCHTAVTLSFRNESLRQTIGSLLVVCPFENCNTEVKYDDLEQHCMSCTVQTAECQLTDSTGAVCGAVCVKGEQQQHEEMCINQRVLCPTCEELMTRQEFHKHKCSAGTVMCQFCQLKVKRKDLYQHNKDSSTVHISSLLNQQVSLRDEFLEDKKQRQEQANLIQQLSLEVAQLKLQLNRVSLAALSKPSNTTSENTNNINDLNHRMQAIESAVFGSLGRGRDLLSPPRHNSNILNSPSSFIAVHSTEPIALSSGLLSPLHSPLHCTLDNNNQPLLQDFTFWDTKELQCTIAFHNDDLYTEVVSVGGTHWFIKVQKCCDEEYEDEESQIQRSQQDNTATTNANDSPKHTQQATQEAETVTPTGEEEPQKPPEPHNDHTITTHDEDINNDEITTNCENGTNKDHIEACCVNVEEHEPKNVNKDETEHAHQVSEEHTQLEKGEHTQQDLTTNATTHTETNAQNEIHNLSPKTNEAPTTESTNDRNANHRELEVATQSTYSVYGTTGCTTATTSCTTTSTMTTSDANDDLLDTFDTTVTETWLNSTTYPCGKVDIYLYRKSTGDANDTLSCRVKCNATIKQEHTLDDVAPFTCTADFVCAGAGNGSRILQGWKIPTKYRYPNSFVLTLLLHININKQPEMITATPLRLQKTSEGSVPVAAQPPVDKAPKRQKEVTTSNNSSPAKPAAVSSPPSSTRSRKSFGFGSF